MICKNCSEEKPDWEFRYSSGAKQQNRTCCRACYAKIWKERRQTPSYKKFVREYSRKRYLKFRDKHIARSKVARAVKNGIIIKPDTCENCGDKEPLQGHHEDYTKPLEVRWLCRICHLDLHGGIVDKTILKEKL